MLFGKFRKKIDVEDGYICVISKNDRVTKFLKPGTYTLSSSEKCVYKIPTTPQIVSDNHCKDGTILTKDRQDIGFSYDAECQVVDPELFYKKRIIGLEFQNTRRAVYEMLKRKIRQYTHEELVNEVIFKHGGTMELNEQDLNQISNSSEWGVKISKIVFKPHIHGSHYEYWTAFCEQAKKIPQFTQLFGLPAIDHDEVLNLWSHDSRYTINIWRDIDNHRICVEFLVANAGGCFEKVVARETEIEHQLQWDMEWKEQKDRAFSIISVTKAADEDVTDKSQWNDQFDWMIDKAILMREAVSDIIGTDSGNRQAKRELVQYVCKHCGAPLDASTRICTYCGMKHVEIRA